MAFSKNLFIKQSLYLSVNLSSSYSIDWSTGWKITLIYYRHVDQSFYWTSNQSTIHYTEHPTCRQVSLLNAQPVDQSLYWTAELSTSHSIYLSTPRPVTPMTFDLSTSDYWSFYLSSSRSHYHMTKYADKSDKSFYWLINCWLFRLLDYRHVNKSIQWPIHRESVTLLSTTRPTCIYIISRRF